MMMIVWQCNALELFSSRLERGTVWETENGFNCEKSERGRKRERERERENGSQPEWGAFASVTVRTLGTYKEAAPS